MSGAGGKPSWTREDLREWYATRSLDLAWLGRPGRHHFRWRDADGAWRLADRRVPDARRLAALLARRPPRDLYVGTAAWLEPVGLPRVAERDRPAPVLLDHLVVFDVDRPPFALDRLERARRDAASLARWCADEAGLELVHVAFSGSKGFHVVCRDPDRAAFAEPEPRRREAAVRDARRALFTRAADAGHDVDGAVTADTRRVVRLPGSVHGSTGWACQVVPPDRVERPLEEWVDDLARLPTALPLPRRAPRRRLAALAALATRLRLPAKRAPPPSLEARALQLEASTHVTGSRDRSALLAWLPRAWGAGDAARRRADALLTRVRLGPGVLFAEDGRLLALVPRAVPRPALAAAADAAGLAPLARALDARGHAWVRVAPRHAVGEAPPTHALAPAGVVAGDATCAHPWSRPHLDLARRLGQSVGDVGGASCGRDRVMLRLAELR